MRLNTLKPGAGARKAGKRLGRGIGSGLGKTSGRGHKGQHARAGGFHKVGFEGGQMPLQRRVPKRGFRRLQKREKERQELAIVNLRDLAGFAEGATVDAGAMVERGLIKAGQKIKILGDGELSTKLTVRADAFSGSAREKIAQAGGTAELIQQAVSE